MMKKLVAVVLIFLILGTSGIVCYADNTSNRTGRVEMGKYFFELSEPEKDTATTDKNMLLSFKASRGTNVCIEVYHNGSIDKNKENYMLLYDPIDINVGVLQRGWASIDLRPGLNKVRFSIEYRNGSKDNMERTIDVMDMEEVGQLLRDMISKPTLGILKKQ
ncbi:MAG TPA: hypothetical protein VFC70_00110 [Oscillospiraceae bacterium]|nr:hypothetical protein [Oscillospiraceae bacterium]